MSDAPSHGAATIEGFLLLEDGTLFRGTLSGAAAPTVAEVVFTTNMTGYQEIFSDPSMSGQVVVVTAPQVGNCGVNDEDLESPRPQVAAVVAREISRTHSNWRATGGLAGWLAAAGVPVLDGVDTRRLTRHLRAAGVMRGVIAAGSAPTREALAALESCPPMEGRDLASVVSTREPYQWGAPDAPLHVVAYDFGIKRNSLRLLEQAGCRVTVVPADTPAASALERSPDGVFLSNGPGDPAAVAYAPATIRAIVDAGVPVFGICLGHQLIGLAFGGRTAKMPFGHRGGNHPVRALATGRILITSQNHGFAVAAEPAGAGADGELGVAGAPELAVTHLNLNDGTVEGLRHRERPVFGVQYDPEAAPGPHDARGHFAAFLQAMREGTTVAGRRQG